MYACTCYALIDKSSAGHCLPRSLLLASATHRMSNPFPLRGFRSFATALRQTQLPGSRDRRLLREIYSLAARRRYLETESQQIVKNVARIHRPVIGKWRSVLSAIERTRKLLAEVQGHCEEMYPDPIYWQNLFHPAAESLSDISHVIEQTQQRTIDKLHPRSLKKREAAKWNPLFPQYDYPPKRFGWKPVETWFLEELDDLLYRYFRECKAEPAPGDRYNLIQAVLKAAFNERKELDTIKVAVLRIAKHRDRPLGK